MQVHIQCTFAMVLIEDGLKSGYLLISLSVFKSSINTENIAHSHTRNTGLVKDVPSSSFLIITQKWQDGLHFLKNALYCVNYHIKIKHLMPKRHFLYSQCKR